MKRFVLHRILQAIPLMIAITLVIFIIIDAMPGNELISYINSLPEGSPRPSPEQISQMQEVLQYNRPWHIRYFEWFTNALRGDFGTSLYYRRPASDIVGILIWRTFMLNFTSMVFTFLLAIPIGVRSAAKRNSLFDNFFSTTTLIAISLPAFFIGIYLMRLLAVNVSWIPPTGMRSIIYIIKGYPNKLVEVLDVMRHMILPVLTLTLVGVGSVSRFIRNAVVDVINQDYIRTARSKGLKERTVIYKHALRNALIPIISLVGVMIPTLFVGNIFVEAVFSWPGIGLEFLYAVFRRDTSMLSLLILIFALASVFGNFLADLLYGIADPKMNAEMEDE
ncbi:MAG: ABC transporter permease [Clostridia bacterium]|nr:ABC transporter permease [Clostridia bacterium]